MTEQADLRHFFSEGIEDCMDALYGAALRLTRNDTDAEDLVAECVAKAWSSIDSLGDRTLLRPWLFRILRNHFISDYRKSAVRPAFASLDETSDNAEDGDLVDLLNEQPDEFLIWWAHPEMEVANKILGEQIMAAIEGLPEAFRATIMLVNVEGLGYDEAAEVLGVPPGTVRSRMKRGRTMLQKALWEQARDAGLAIDQVRRS